MLVLHSSQPQPRRPRPVWRRRIDAAATSVSAWLRTAWLEAFPPRRPEPPPETPGPLPPIPRAGALREGALLSEQTGEAIAGKRVA
jgi:hypothetical protein